METPIHGFHNPPVESSIAFRAILNAMSKPGSVQPILVDLAPVEGINKGTQLAALTLTDHESPVWLDNNLAKQSVIEFLRFHCSAPVSSDLSGIQFAFLSKWHGAASLPPFPLGTPTFPDRSTTLIIEVESFKKGEGVTLSGPGVKTTENFDAVGLGPDFWSWMQQNNARFPLGMDVILTTDKEIAALPRSVKILEAY